MKYAASQLTALVLVLLFTWMIPTYPIFCGSLSVGLILFVLFS